MVKYFMDSLVQWQRGGFINRDVWLGMGNIVQPELLLPGLTTPAPSGAWSSGSLVASSRVERDTQCKKNILKQRIMLFLTNNFFVFGGSIKRFQYFWLSIYSPSDKHLQGWQSSRNTTKNHSSFAAEIHCQLIG